MFGFDVQCPICFTYLNAVQTVSLLQYLLILNSYNIIQVYHLLYHQQHPMLLELYIATYQGNLTILHSNLSQLQPVKNLQLSENSIKAICPIIHTKSNGKNSDKYLVLGGYDQQIRVVDLQVYQEKVEAKQNVGQVTAITQVDHNLFAVGTDDGTIRLWNSHNWNIVKQARFHKKSISSIVIAKQGKLMISSGGNSIIVWSAQTLHKAHVYKFPASISIEHMKLSEDTKFIFYSTGSQLHRMCTENNKQQLMVKLPSPRKIQDFLLFNNFVVIADDIGTVMAWIINNQILQQNQNQTQNNADKQAEDNNKQQLQYQKRVWFKAHQSRIKSIKIIQHLLIVVTAAGHVSIWDFPEFLQSIDNISQNYNLDGLKPLCQTTMKGRILCVDAIKIKDLSQKIQKQNNSQLQQDVNEQDQIQQQGEKQQQVEQISKKLTKKKNKKIKKQLSEANKLKNKTNNKKQGHKIPQKSNKNKNNNNNN